jgi:hypothetical protein
MRQYRTFSNLPQRIQSAILCQVAMNRIKHYSKESEYENFRRAASQFQFDKKTMATARRILRELTGLPAVAAKQDLTVEYAFVDAEIAADAERRTQMQLIGDQVMYYNDRGNS